MKKLLFKRRFTIFLISFMVMLFGNVLFPESIRGRAEMVLLLLNMLCGTILFQKQSRREKMLISAVIAIGILARLNQEYMQVNTPYLFASIYLVYFALISYRLFVDLNRQKVVGIETISGAFCGFILLGVVSAIFFMTINRNLHAFDGLVTEREFYDFLYFSFITLLTIGYGDITPTLEVSKKMVVVVGLLGHFYTVFITAIVIGKYLRTRKG